MPHPDAGLTAARAAIAAVCLDALPDAGLGEIHLRDDQRRIVARAQRAIGLHGGCLIAEDVGRGKTYIALALARQWQRPIVIVPACLRTTWRSAAQRAGVDCSIISHESLSRGRVAFAPFDGIIVDESHHFRTPATRRYSALASLAARAPLVMLSATPLQNRPRDLASQLALFLGEMTFTLETSALSRFVIRGDDAPDAILPIAMPPEWIALDADDDGVLEAILALAPPAKPLDAGDAGTLRTINLVRAWASSRAALEAALRSRRRVATALEQGVEAGRVPTRREARSWHGAENVVQLGFASLLMLGEASPDTLAALRSALKEDRCALDRLIAAMRRAPDPDAARIAALLSLRAAHPASRIIAFSEYATTIASFFAALRGEPGVGMLTGKEARIASGRIAHDEMLARFAPLAQRVRPAPAHEAVTLLLATDLLAEGVNLQDASVVLHIDLPWNPARLAQRVGRVRRPGGAERVRSYLLAPPASATALLDAETRLRRKLEAAERIVGASMQVLPDLSRASIIAVHGIATQYGEPKSGATAEGALLARLGRWQRSDVGLPRCGSPCLIAASEGSSVAWLVALDDGRIVCSLDGIVSDTMSCVVRVAELAEGDGRPAGDIEVHSALASMRAWLGAEQMATTLGLAAPRGPLRQRLLRWLSVLPHCIPRHQRAAALPMIARIRDELLRPMPLGIEMQLAAHADDVPGHGADALDRLWHMARLLGETRRYRHVSLPPQGPANAIALIVIGPGTS